MCLKPDFTCCALVMYIDVRRHVFRREQFTSLSVTPFLLTNSRTVPFMENCTYASQLFDMGFCEPRWPPSTELFHL